MFLICNGILAFLVKTLSLNNTNSSSFSGLEDVDENDSSAKITEINGLEQESESESESFPEINVAPGDDEEDQKHLPQVVEAAVADDEVLEMLSENEGRKTGDFIIESEELEMLSEVNNDDDEEEEEEEEEVGGTLGEQDMDVMINMNTEELNEKFEEFIRKMKEELRIQEQQQQLIAAV